MGWAANNHFLLWATPVLPTIPILGLFWLKPKEELFGWLLFTVWLGSTYASLGIGLITVLAIGGLFFSPWLFVVAWFGHIVWDFLPRELPELFLQLPQACVIFDGLIGGYLIWRIMSKHRSLRNWFSIGSVNIVQSDVV